MLISHYAEEPVVLRETVRKNEDKGITGIAGLKFKCSAGVWRLEFRGIASMSGLVWGSASLHNISSRVKDGGLTSVLSAEAWAILHSIMSEQRHHWRCITLCRHRMILSHVAAEQRQDTNLGPGSVGWPVRCQQHSVQYIDSCHICAQWRWSVQTKADSDRERNKTMSKPGWLSSGLSGVSMA